ncbi:unnamed protein product [Oncorhynchus mykiss]|uniref:Uncharacterized protein n=1 Tax=Oncorhynchus mykiss TaxID=8022 RepID=A0A060VMV2_ONCMY|nr:unnamed protein product [Oncorhynchus mykiss]
MKKAITAEQITEWFTLGTHFANILITDEVPKEVKLEESSIQSWLAS